MRANVWFKFGYIREELEDIYPGEYTVERVAAKAGISKQGLRDAEGSPRGKSGGRIKPRETTIERLAEAYGVPPRIFAHDCTVEEITGFYLGKTEDKDEFFDDFYHTYRQQHILDRVDRTIDRNMYGRAYTYVNNYAPDDFGFDVVHHADGEFALDRLSIEVIIRAKQTSSNNVLWEKRIGEDSTVFPTDIEALDELIVNDLRFLSSRFSKLIELSEPTGEMIDKSSLKEMLDKVRAVQHKAIDQAYLAALEENDSNDEALPGQHLPNGTFQSKD